MTAEKILIADDEKQDRKELGEHLTRRGYQVKAVDDGLEALKSIRDDPPHLLISDVDMPYINGFELVRRLRHDHRTARLPIVMLSTRRAHQDILTAYAEGADEYIPKPVEMAIVEAKIEALLRRTKPAVEKTERPPGKTIAFLRAKGGVGATSLAVNVAVALASSGTHRTAILDLNLEFGNAALLMNVRPRLALSDIAQMPADEVDDATFAQLLAAHGSGATVTVGAAVPEHAELVGAALVGQVVDRLRRQADLVLMDMPATFSQTTLAAIDAADLLIVITTPHIGALKSTVDLLAVLAKLRIPAERTVLLLDRVASGGASNEEAARVFGRKIELVVPHMPLMDEAATRGLPLVEWHPDSSGAAQLRELAAKVAALAEAAAPAGQAPDLSAPVDRPDPLVRDRSGRSLEHPYLRS